MQSCSRSQDFVSHGKGFRRGVTATSEKVINGHQLKRDVFYKSFLSPVCHLPETLIFSDPSVNVLKIEWNQRLSYTKGNRGVDA